MRPSALLLPLLLVGCAGLGGPPPEAWKLSAEPVAEGVLVKWNVPDAPGRKLDLEVRRGDDRQVVERVSLSGADVHARVLDTLAFGDWEFNLVVTDAGAGQKALRAGPVAYGVERVPVRPLMAAELGLGHDLGVPVLVAVPAWGGVLSADDEAVRASLEHLALETARVAFGAAYLVHDDADVRQVRDVRERLLEERVAGLPLDLDARGLVLVDLRPALDDGAPTLTLRLLDIAYREYHALTPLPWNRYGLVFEDYVPIEGLPYAAGRSHSRPLLAGFRQLYTRLASDTHVLAWQDAASGPDVFGDGQARLKDVVGWVGHIEALPGGGRTVGDVESSLLFMRDVVAPVEADTSETPDTSEAPDGAPAAEEVTGADGDAVDAPDPGTSSEDGDETDVSSGDASDAPSTSDGGGSP